MQIIHKLDLKNPTKRSNYYDLNNFSGMPVYWRDDVSGEMQPAVQAFINQSENPQQLDLVILYLRYFIHAPVWLESRPFKATPETEARMQQLRKFADGMKTRQEVDQFILCCMEIGLDPL